MEETTNIFLLEDDEEDVLFLKEILADSKNRYHIETATFLDEGLNKIYADRCNLIVCDLNLPDSQGINTFRQLISKFPSLPIIVLTGNSDEELGEKAVSEGAQDFISKSELNKNIFEKTIRYAITRKEIALKLEESEKKYRDQAQMLEEANLYKDVFIDIVTHDLRGQISSISGLAELLQEDYPKNKIIGAINNSSHHVLKIVDNSKVLSQILNHEPIPKKNLSIYDMVKRIIDQCSGLIHKYEVEIINEIDRDLYLQCNEILEHLFLNYIKNAVFHAHQGKLIKINSVLENGYITFKVNDWGQTLDSEYRERIFERQLKGNDCNERNGLGLSIVKKIALAHDAEVWVEPNNTKGNSFCLKMKK